MRALPTILPLLWFLPSAISALSAHPPQNIWIAEIRGTINPASSSYLETSIRQAEADNAQALIVELDTPGGLLSSVRQMAQTIDTSTIPIVVYVAPAGASATSAGALLMLASHVAAMAPGTNIGAAHPVGPQGEEIKGAMGEKAVSDTAAFARGLAELKGRNREAAQEVVSKSKSFTAEEALKNNLIEVVAITRQDLLKQLDGRTIAMKTGARTLRTSSISESTIKTSSMTPGQKLLHYLANPNIAGILMTLGILLIYIEISNPGITIAGFLGAVCLLVAFMAFQLLPIRVGGLALLLFGIILLIVEPFVVSHGAFAAGGILSFILGLIWVIDPSSSAMRVSPSVWIPASVVLGGLVFLIGMAAARMRKLTQKTLSDMGGGALIGLSGYEGQVESIQGDGTKGKALFRGELWNYESDEPLKPGDAVHAVRVHGLGGMVVQVKKSHHVKR